MKGRIKGLFGKLKTKLNNLGRKKTLAIVLSITFGVVIVASVGITYAKYRKQHSSDNAFSAKSFYFESNLLKKDGATYSIYNNKITFDITNFPDELRSSDVDITYEVNITSPDGGTIPQNPTRTGTILAKQQGGETKTPTSVTIEYDGLDFGKTYTVTAMSTLPYTKTISATFITVAGNYQVPYTLVDNGDYVLMTLTTTDYVGNVNISWQNGYVPDNSEPILTNATGTSHVASVVNNSTYTLKFFKENTNVTYDAARFSVSK